MKLPASAIFATAALLGGVALAMSLVQGCGGASNGGSIFDPTGYQPDPDADAVTIEFDLGGETSVAFDPCGPRPRTCDPDLGNLCTPVARDAGSRDGAADADASGDGATDGARGDADASTLDGATDANVDADDSGAGTVSACRVVTDGVSPITTCAPAGFGGRGHDCRDDGDCAPGFACVGSPAQCLAYCCSAYATGATPTTGDHSGDFCTLLPVARATGSTGGDAGAEVSSDASDATSPSDGSATDATADTSVLDGGDAASSADAADGADGGDASPRVPRVPVWAPLEPCTLLDDSHCAAGSTCSVVTNTGGTTCIPAGTGRDLAPCNPDAPCAPGYVCAGPRDARACRKICQKVDDCPGHAACQLLPSMPTNFGLCAAGDAG